MEKNFTSQTFESTSKMLQRESQSESDDIITDHLFSAFKNLNLSDARLASILNIALRGMESPCLEMSLREEVERKQQPTIREKVKRKLPHCSECRKLGILTPGKNKTTHGQIGHGH